MSMIICKNCERQLDSDFVEFGENEVCVDCEVAND